MCLNFSLRICCPRWTSTITTFSTLPTCYPTSESHFKSKHPARHACKLTSFASIKYYGFKDDVVQNVFSLSRNIF